MAIFMNKLNFELAAVATVFIVISISGVQGPYVPTSLQSLFAFHNTPRSCHSPFEYQTGLFLTTDRVDGYSSEPPEDVSSQFVGWYFSKSDGVCKTLYLRAGVKPFAGNKDLPKSKDECNTKCVKKTQS